MIQNLWCTYGMEANTKLWRDSINHPYAKPFWDIPYSHCLITRSRCNVLIVRGEVKIWKEQAYKSHVCQITLKLQRANVPKFYRGKKLNCIHLTLTDAAEQVIHTAKKLTKIIERLHSQYQLIQPVTSLVCPVNWCSTDGGIETVHTVKLPSAAP